jgi:hypothetical protein
MSADPQPNAPTPEEQGADFLERLFASKPDQVAFLQALHGGQPGLPPIEVSDHDPTTDDPPEIDDDP